AGVNNRDVRSLERFLQTLKTLPCIGGVECADEDHHFTALWQRFFEKLTSLTARGDVVGADITHAVAVRRITILRHYQCLLRNSVKHSGLVFWVNRADGDALHAGCQQVVDDALLFRGRTAGRNSEIDLDVRYLFRSFFRSLTGDGPELGCIIGHESELVLRSGAAAGSICAGRRRLAGSENQRE